MSSGQVAASAQAVRSTHSPIGTISPVSSAIGMKSSGAIMPRVGMAPAQQRLEAGDAAAGNVDQRLVMDLELASAQRAAQIGFELAPLLRGALHLRLEEAIGAVALRLRLVEREVGVLEQFVGVGAVGGQQRDADAGADRRPRCPSIA